MSPYSKHYCGNEVINNPSQKLICVEKAVQNLNKPIYGHFECLYQFLQLLQISTSPLMTNQRNSLIKN